MQTRKLENIIYRDIRHNKYMSILFISSWVWPTHDGGIALKLILFTYQYFASHFWEYASYYSPKIINKYIDWLTSCNPPAFFYIKLVFTIFLVILFCKIILSSLHQNYKRSVIMLIRATCTFCWLKIACKLLEKY